MENEYSFILSLTLEKMFVKRGHKQCLVCDPKKNAHLKAAAAIQGPPFNCDNWFRKWNNGVQQFKTKCEGKKVINF